MSEKLQSLRYNKIDELRGFTIINMVLYHGIWDFVYQYGASMPWYHSEIGYIWQQCICCFFILISGFCWKMGRHHLKDGFLIFGSGILVSTVTLLFSYDSRIIYGVLTMIGSCMLIMIILEKGLDKIPAGLGAAGAIILFLFTRNINRGYFGSEHLAAVIQLPRILYANYFSTYFGFPMREFYSSDYFSLIPWIFLYITGYFLYRIVKYQNRIRILEKGRIPFLRWIGKKSLWIYLLHQPIIEVIFLLIYH